jgi:hypothetical protein
MTSTRQRNAEKAGFAYLTLPLRCGNAPKEWLCPTKGTVMTVERAVLSHFESQGWRGYWREGGLLLSLIKSMSFKSLDYDERTRYIEALYTLAAQPQSGRPYTVSDLLACVAAATPEQIARNFDHMNSRGPFHEVHENWSSSNTSSIQDAYPGLERWMLLELFQVAGTDLLHRIATIFATDPYEFRRGWPDITMWKDGQLRFVEVKAPGDSLGKSQKTIAQHFALPLGLDFTMIDVLTTI